ncbi:MAG: N-acetylmuramoyl-L-alanine amidase [Rickettsiales bacterium]|nr:N-acetylmuramoyl-L-alanine amidase [Rickettsiales bacterium]
MKPYRSPNYDSRDNHPIDMLVLHYTGMLSATQALDRLCDPAAKVSAHYVVEEDGTIHNLVYEKERAWHAGVSAWRGHSNINQRSIGIEIVNPGHEFGYTPFPEPQIAAVISLCKGILTRNPQISARNVVGHSDVAPARKTDPGEFFPWAQLAKHTIGLWPRHATATTLPESALADYGYSLENPTKAIEAFQRHFRQNHISGQWDSQCGALLADLIRML